MKKCLIVQTKHKICILLIHHLKKGNENDVFNKISGTNGISGVADTTLVLNKKERNDLNTILSIVGRDVEFNEFIIQFDKNIYKWKMVASYEEQKERDLKNMYDTSPLVDTIKTLVTEHNGKWAGSLKDIEIKQKELYSSLIENKVNKSDLNHIIPLLEKYDNIIYWENTYPIKGKRLKNFCKKKSVESVENVDK